VSSPTGTPLGARFGILDRTGFIARLEEIPKRDFDKNFELLVLHVHVRLHSGAEAEMVAKAI
jgi:hypothetical protein